MQNFDRTTLSAAPTALLLLVVLLLGECARAGETYYVDPQLGEASSTTYDPAARKSGAGKCRAFKTLKEACEAAGAGATVYLRGGTYGEPLAPKNSGAEGQYLTFKNYEKEDALITGEKLFPAVQLTDRKYIAIEGLHVEKVQGWLHAVRAQHILLKGNVFRQALNPGGSAKTGLFFQQAHDNRVLENTIDESTQDNLALVKSDRNLIEGNVFTKAKHVLWTIKGGNFNIVRRNYLHNIIQKIGEVFDCEHVGFDHEFTENNCTKHNLIERNVFAHTASSGDHSPFCGIQYAGQDGLIRHNIYYDCIGPALDFTAYPEEARYNTGNRACHNVFYKTHYAGIVLAGAREDSKYAFQDNVLRNNVLVKNVFIRNDKRWEWFKELDGKPVQVLAGAAKGFLFEHNLLFNEQSGEKYLISIGGRTSKSNVAATDLAGSQAAYGEAFKDNLEADPQFADGDKRDFRLKPGSPAIDAAAFLTQAAGAGEGTALPVKDARWFCDGFGIEGVQGDLVQLEGQPKAARVVKVDYEKNVLTLAEPLKWTDGQGVSFAYAGKAPDLGAFEAGAPEPALPPPPPPGTEK